MRSLARFALTVSSAAALLVGCGTPQPPIGASGAMPRSAIGARGDSVNYKVLYDFRGVPDGGEPEASLVDVGGKLYGTTYRAGALKDGYVFTVTTSGHEQVLYSFTARSNGRDGANGLRN
jgi:hypothetical protein